MNHGDTIKLILAYTVDEEPITEGQFDEIEFTIGDKRFTLDDGVVWDSNEGAYTVFLTQEDTFAMPYSVPYQVRLKKGAEVASHKFGTLDLGATLSRTVL